MNPSALSSTELSTVPSTGPAEIQWRVWPLRDDLPTSLLVPVGIGGLSGGLAYSTGSLLIGIVALAALVSALATFLFPTTYEIGVSGMRRRLLGRRRRTPWHAILSYQPRASGLVLFGCSEPVAFDVLGAEFLPYADDPDETLSAVRQFLPHATELPSQM